MDFLEQACLADVKVEVNADDQEIFESEMITEMHDLWEKRGRGGSIGVFVEGYGERGRGFPADEGVQRGRGHAGSRFRGAIGRVRMRTTCSGSLWRRS
jgi:hypothetical protein